MAIKLGELLLKEKLITPEQLDEALKNQAIFGIKLGSAMIELGYVTDEQLCSLLGRKLGVPAAPPRALSLVAPNVLALVPLELAVKHRVIPIALDGKRLALAMADPTDFKAIDEVAFVTSLVIVPHIVPEVRMDAALLKHYQVRRSMRYLEMEAEIDKQKRATSIATRVTQAAVDNPMTKISSELLNIGIPSEFSGFTSFAGDADHLGLPHDMVEQYTVDNLSLEFASARNRDQIANVFIKYLGQEFRVGALFILRNDVAVGWRGIAGGKRLDELENMDIPLQKLSVLNTVYETGQYSMGTLLEVEEDKKLLAALGLESGTPLLVLPIVMRSKVVAEVVVSADMDAIGPRLNELQKLVTKASMAFEMLILKNKILMT